SLHVDGGLANSTPTGAEYAEAGDGAPTADALQRALAAPTTHGRGNGREHAFHARGRNQPSDRSEAVRAGCVGHTRGRTRGAHRPMERVDLVSGRGDVAGPAQLCR